MKKTSTLIAALLLSAFAAFGQMSERIGYPQPTPNIGLQLNAMRPVGDLNTNTTPARSGGTGTYDDPYLVSSAEELAEIATRVNNGTEAAGTIFPNGNPGYADQFFLLTKDIDLSDYTPWMPISIPGEKIFFGHFDGDWHTITHLTTDFSTNNSNQGLFSVIGAGASVSNLSIKDSHITGVQYTGAFVGAAGEGSEIYNCHNFSDVDATYYYAGGIAGASWGVIERCTNSGNITSGMDFIGGIVGDFYGDLTNCINTGNISGSTSTGGIVGYSANAAIADCLNAGNIYATSGYSGGVVGFVTNYDSENTTARLLNVGGCYGPSIKAVIGRLWTEDGQPSHANNCYYDRQMTDKTGVTPGNDVEGVVEPRFTHELTSYNMAGELGWSVSNESYPSPGIFWNHYNATLFVAIAPAWFRFANETEYDRFDDVRDDFRVNNDFYGLTWESTTGKVDFYENFAQLLDIGQDTLVVTLDDARKEIIINITDILGVNETTASKMIAYPNPTNGLLTIEGIEATETQVFNAIGQQVMSFKGNEAHLGHLPQGLYLLKSTDESGLLHQTRLVVSH
ncbi:MAG: T9SS type A sorting domain-containing protein [Bacteroidales bacterium]|nr:T9SS type A sorting domain-containing protein [Bacteroidales bacterium]